MHIDRGLQIWPDRLVVRFCPWSRVALLTLASACQFERPPNVGEEDARVIDAPAACVADTIDCDDALGVYTDCSSTGTAEVRIECPLGCAVDQEKCLDIDPHNGLAMYLDRAGDAPDLRLVGESIIDTQEGTILVGGRSVAVPTFMVPGAYLRVFVVRSLSLDGVASVRTYPSSPGLAFVSHGDVVLTGTFDLSATGYVPGPGGYPGNDIQDPAPCLGQPGSSTTPGSGGGGGGGATDGADGGETAMHLGGPGGEQTTILTPFRGGCAGGYVLDFQANEHGFGGGGGGALQIASRTRIEISGAGVVDASGGGGTHGSANTAGSGGGAGGTLLLEAPQIILRGTSVVVSTKGGGGAGAGDAVSSSGADGGYDSMPAPGGPSNVQAAGGAGGTELYAPHGGRHAGSSVTSAGGGGGAVGTTAFFTSAGVIAPQDGATLRTHHTEGRIAVRTVP